ncbi:MAG: epoxyqueuosine reductase QueH, partial [Eubacteriales bacterium]|nr:epoxyqueuosine reductase QueH [Eubacteriales bacterium]
DGLDPDELSKLGNGRLLMHVCCAPCSEYPLFVLRHEGFSVDGLFYNPNIHPFEEWLLRLENLALFSELHGFKAFNHVEPQMERWLNHPSVEKDKHCAMCYAMRMDYVAAFAARHGYAAFTTSLLVSPYQNQPLLMQMAETAARRHGVSFYRRHYMEGYRLGQTMAHDDALYCQKYCACIFSMLESRYKKKLLKRFDIDPTTIPVRQTRHCGMSVELPVQKSWSDFSTAEASQWFAARALSVS